MSKDIISSVKMQNRIILNIAAILIFSSTIVSHSSYAQEPDYFPMNIGNKWFYNYHGEDMWGNSFDESDSIMVIDSLSQGYVFDKYFLYFSIFARDSSFFRNDSGRIIRKRKGNNLLWYDFTAAVGDTYLIPVRDNILAPPDTIDIIAEVLNKSDIFIFKGDTIKNCIRFLFSSSKFTPLIHPWEESFAPGIGYVYGSTDGDEWFSYTLTSAIINGLPVSVLDPEPGSGFSTNYYSLEQNYPNPFNPSTTISYSLPKSSHVSLKIFNLAGQEISTLVNQLQLAGAYEILWNAHSLPSGVCLCRLEAGGYVHTRKLLLIR